MKIKVYNENGNIKITKVTSSGVEHTMFHDLYAGEFVEINIESNITVNAKKDYDLDILLSDEN